jgi:Icc-related predicted phosphoesterase
MAGKGEEVMGFIDYHLFGHIHEAFGMIQSGETTF